MSEYCTEAIVLGRRESGGQNLLASLYTKALGRVEARVISGRKITSKLSPHLDSGTLVFCRLVHKNQYTLTDVLLEERFFSDGKGARHDSFFRLVFLLEALLPTALPDPELWEILLRHLRVKEIPYTMVLSLLGYGAESARCESCSGARVNAFFVPDQHFFCGSCVTLFPEHKLLFF